MINFMWEKLRLQHLYFRLALTYEWEILDIFFRQQYIKPLWIDHNFTWHKYDPVSKRYVGSVHTVRVLFGFHN